MKNYSPVKGGVIFLLEFAYYFWLLATIVCAICWVLDATQPIPAPYWLEFNLSHPVIMYTGLGSILIFIFIYGKKIIDWLRN